MTAPSTTEPAGRPEPAPTAAPTPRRSPWELYDRLVAGIPSGPVVTDAAIAHWTVVTADTGGAGIAMTYEGGPRPSAQARDVVGRELREVAALATSWSLDLASLGVAAINVWYNTPERLAQHGAAERGPSANTFLGRADDHWVGRKVVVVGRFGGIDRFRSADLVVLERRPQGEDLPDPAAEYVIPEADTVLITGSALVNKTLPRLLELARGAEVHLVGPTTPLAPEVFAGRVSTLAGAVITDPATCRRRALVGTSGRDMTDCLEMYTLPVKGIRE